MPLYVTDLDGPTAHRFSLRDGVVIDAHGANPRVVLRKDTIRVGCALITPEAAKHILAQWDKAFGASEPVQLQ